MKSKLLTEGRGEDFFNDFQLLIDIPENLIVSASNIISEFAERNRVPETSDYINIVKGTNFSVEKLVRSLRVILHIFDYIKANDDDLHLIVEDLVSINPKIDYDSLMKKFEPFSVELRRKILGVRNAEKIVSNCFPKLAAFQTRAVIAFSFEPSFNIDKDSPDTYVPNINEYAPGIAVKMLIKQGEKEETINFGMTLERTKEIIKWLQLALIEATSIKSHIKDI